MSGISDIDKKLNGYRELYERFEISFGGVSVKETRKRGHLNKIVENFDVLIGWKESRKAIKKLFVTSEIMEKPNDAENKKLLKLIRDDKDPYIQLVGANVENIEDYFDEDYVVMLNEKYDLENFRLREMEAGRVISDKRVPPTFLTLFEKIKECYMFGLYEATIIFCRALLEEVLENHINKRDEIVNIRRKTDKWPIKVLICKSSLPKILKEEAHKKIRETAGKILHNPKEIKEFPIKKADITTGGGKKFASVSVKMNDELKQEALSSIKVIISVIEDLYNHDRS